MISFLLNAIRRWYWNRQRYIFRYWNGTRIVLGDPLVLYRNLMAHPDFTEEDFKLLEVDSLRQKIISKLAGISREIFGFKLADDGGLTDLECFSELQAFRLYTGMQKKSIGQSQTSPEPTDTPPSQDSAHRTSMNEDSGST